MQRFLLAAVLLGAVNAACTSKGQKATLWDFTCLNVTGQPVALSQFTGKVVLVMNTASM